MRSIIRISDGPAELLIECPDCGRRGRYARKRAMAAHGDISLPDLLATLSADCPRRMQTVNGAACSARYSAETVDAWR